MGDPQELEKLQRRVKMTPTEYILANPEHSVTICKNVIASKDDLRLRIVFEHRQGPYRPRQLGTYVVNTWEEALELRARAKTAYDDTNISEKGNPLNGQPQQG